jgi:hypothetical protein
MSARVVYVYLVTTVLIFWYSITLVQGMIYQPPCMGNVSVIDTANQTLHLDNVTELQDKRWVGWGVNSIKVSRVNPAVFSQIAVGDSVIISKCWDGGTVARLAGPGEQQRFATAIFGDRRHIPVPLAGDYEVVTRLVPNCSSCDMVACRAPLAEVTVLHAGSELINRTFERNGSFEFNEASEGCTFSFRFVSGSTPIQSCDPHSDSHFFFDPTGSESIILVNCPSPSPLQAGEGAEATMSLTGTSQPATQNAAPGSNPLPSFTLLLAVISLVLVLVCRRYIR